MSTVTIASLIAPALVKLWGQVVLFISACRMQKQLKSRLQEFSSEVVRGKKKKKMWNLHRLSPECYLTGQGVLIVSSINHISVICCPLEGAWFILNGEWCLLGTILSLLTMMHRIVDWLRQWLNHCSFLEAERTAVYKRLLQFAW